ncbi:MAG: AAA family ATPase, partial [Pseudomonadota bacterium]
MDRSEAEQAVTKILTFADIDDKPPEEKKRPEVMDLDPTLWDGVAPKDREFLIDGWLPSGCVTLLSGDGGIGKSLVAMQAATAVATGTPFLGLKTTKAPVLAIYAEDDPDELHRRQLSICDAFEISMKDLGGMRLAGRVGENNVIARADHNASYVQAEDLWVSIANRAVEMGARLVILDNIAQMFAGNEVNRTEVTQFVALCARLAKQINGAVLLLGHVGKGETAKEYSGSTAWNASVRSRWLLERPEVADDDEANECLRILTKKKANYSSTGDSIALEWQRGAFHLHGYQGDNFVDRMEKRNREKAAEK